MSWLSRLFGRLFGRRSKLAAAPLDLGASPATLERPPPPEAAAPSAPQPTVAPPIPDPEGLAVVEVEADEDAFEEEERAEVSPFDVEADLDRRPDLDVIVADRQARVGDFREAAERLALSGEQRVRLTDPAGPGTLAEALARLELEGRLASRLEEDENGQPVLVYTPVSDGGAPPSAH